MSSGVFHHALLFRREVCIGCSHCMNVCPTRAIRISGGKATLMDDRCVDCGKCYRACPVGAIIVAQDDFSEIFSFSRRVALIPNVLLGQFPSGVSIQQICSVLLELGFTDIFEIEQGTALLEEAMLSMLSREDRPRPLISGFCPAVVRLIQVRFPSLTANLMPLRAPLDVAASYYRARLLDQGVDADEIGIFYITPCAAKIAAVKSPVGEERSAINGVINMDFIYNKVYTSVKQGFGGKKTCKLPSLEPMSAHAMLWSLTEGEAKRMKGRALAIDEIGNVIEFLERLENEENHHIDFLELRACDQSCAGGILTSGNRFYTVERLKKQAAQPQHESPQMPESLRAYAGQLRGLLETGPILPRSMDKLDEDMSVALGKMQRVREIMAQLPYVDCGLCGSPSCETLAEDVVQGKASVNQCIFIQKKEETRQRLSPDESGRILREIWGEDKFQENDIKSRQV